MAYAIAQQQKEQAIYNRKPGASFAGRFFQWAANQDADYHIAWAGGSMIVMAAVFFPLTMSVILFNGASFALMVAAISALALVIVMNLAALPTRYTIPGLLAGILINAGAIVTSLL